MKLLFLALGLPASSAAFVGTASQRLQSQRSRAAVTALEVRGVEPTHCAPLLPP